MPPAPRGRDLALLVLFVGLAQTFTLAQKNHPESHSEAATLFAEQQISFPSERSQLSAVLCLPSSRNEKVPAIVLVRAAGPEEADESALAGSVFAELAHGLARVGIASLRYVPPAYSFSRTPDPKQLPLDRQVVNPAVAALTYLSGVRDVDPSAVFVLGHGVGGTMAPYIAARYGQARGVILMAAAALPIEKALANQKKLELEKQGISDQQVSDILAAQNQTFADIRSGKMPPARLYEGATVAYWRDRMNRDPARKAKTLSVPVLVLQGANDKVYEADYERLRLLLGKKEGGTAQFRLFPNLNHMFTSSKGTQSASSEPGHVDPEVIRVIASWMKSEIIATSRSR